MLQPKFDEEPRWYCIHTKSKSEHIATAHLRQLPDIEVFCPRIRYQKKTRRGKIWFTEALFPGYTFAKFRLGELLRAVNGTHAVLRIIRFGETGYCPLPDGVVEEWQKAVDEETIITIEEELKPGDEIEVMEGPMKGLRTVITKVLPAHERVNILLDMLGQEREVQVNRDAVSKKEDIRLASSPVSR